MKKNLTISFVLVVLTQVAWAQLSEGSKINANTGTGLNTSRAGVFWNSPSPVSNTVGQFYLDTLWQEGSIRFNKSVSQSGGSDSLNGIMIRYNVLNDELEVLANKEKNDVRVIKGNYLKDFTVKKSGVNLSQFASVKDFKTDKDLTGFFETLVSGNLSLMKHYHAKIIKPNYNPGFGTGEKNTIVNIVDDYYAVTNGTAEKINLSKKSLVSIMKTKESNIENYIKSNHVDFKKEEDVIGLFKYYNQ